MATEKYHAECSKRPFSKAAASEGPKAYPQGYVEGLNDARTLLADFFSILLGGEFDEPKSVEILVEPFMVHEFGMVAGFHEAPFVQDEDAIGSLDGRQTVSNHKGRSAFHELLQCLLDEPFRLTVEGRGGFIQQQDSWIFHDGPGNGNALSLTA